MKKLFISFLVAFSLIGCNKSDKKKLHIYTWADYIDLDLVEKFENTHNCKVIIDTYDSNESMYAKLKSGATGYDIITPTSYFVSSLVRDRIIRRIDTNKIENVVKNFDNRFNDKIYAPVFSYTIPYAISYGCLFYNKQKVNGDDANTWNVLCNPKYKGRVTVLDDIRETIGVGLFMSNHSLNTKNQSEINDAIDFIKKAVPNIRKFDNESYKVEVADGSSLIGHGYSSDALQVILGDGETEGRHDLAIAFPREGFTVSCDEFAIMSNAKEVDLAYEFINFLYEPSNCKKNMEYILALTPNIQAEYELDYELKSVLALDEETLKRGQVAISLDDAPEVMEMYNAAWDRIKAVEK